MEASLSRQGTVKEREIEGWEGGFLKNGKARVVAQLQKESAWISVM